VILNNVFPSFMQSFYSCISLSFSFFCFSFSVSHLRLSLALLEYDAPFQFQRITPVSYLDSMLFMLTKWGGWRGCGPLCDNRHIRWYIID